MLGDFYLFTRICRKFLMKRVSLIKFKQIWAEWRQILDRYFNIDIYLIFA